MLLDQVLNSGAMASLEVSAQFAARRQEVLANNIANFSTPNFHPRDVSVAKFQRSLGEAIDRRRKQGGGAQGPLEMKSTREVEVTGAGLRLNPRTPSGNILFHDRNSRDIERTMQAMVENVTAFRVATDLFKSRLDLLNTAIRERI